MLLLICEVFELPYEWLHTIVGLINVLFGVLGGFYALKALMTLYRSPEMLRTQRAIWLPILIGGAFFTFSGPLHFAEHGIFSRFFSVSDVILLRDVLTLIGFSFIVIGVIRYSRLQLEYYRLKWEALQKISKE